MAGRRGRLVAPWWLSGRRYANVETRRQSVSARPGIGVRLEEVWTMRLRTALELTGKVLVVEEDSEVSRRESREIEGHSRILKALRSVV